ncbi:MAG: hypothetical protein JST67_10955 [Bacteroidetes bacterium]|nr:hypothetical protein [Bacteroidota bacterium]
MEETNSFEQETQPQQLKTLCVLTFIYSGMVIFFALMGMLFARNIFSALEENYDTITANFSEKQLEQVKKFMEMGSGKFIIICGVYLLIVGLSAFGAGQMWQKKYNGFVMYVAANACFLISNLISFNIFMAVIDGLFIYLYYKNTRALKRG